jgi:DNA primase
MSILDLLQNDGISTKRVANTHGGEFAGPCPFCGGNDRFRIWPEEGDTGKWWCRRCEKSGDGIQYLRETKGLSYFEACHQLGQAPRHSSSLSWNRKQTQRQWVPKTVVDPTVKWQNKASQLIKNASNFLWSEAGKDAMQWLKTERGLSDFTIFSFHLGWNMLDFWNDREGWGLPMEIKKNGQPKKLWLAKGLTIPYGSQGKILKVKIRRPDPDADPRYYIMPGSSSTSMIIGQNKKAFIIVESELDGLLIFQEAGDLIGVIVLGSAQAKPDTEICETLEQTETILISLDSDEAGAKPAWQWWRSRFKLAKRWPPIQGKDPCEMWKQGINIRSWVEAGIGPGPGNARDLWKERQFDWMERIAISEIDGNLSLDEAEQLANERIFGS